MNLLKFFVLVAPSLADVTCSAPEVCNDELADFALAVKKEGPEEPLKLLQIKEVETLGSSSEGRWHGGHGGHRGRGRRGRHRRHRRHRGRRGRWRRRRFGRRGRRRRHLWRPRRRYPWQCIWRPDLCYMYLRKEELGVL